METDSWVNSLWSTDFYIELSVNLLKNEIWILIFQYLKLHDILPCVFLLISAALQAAL